MSNASFPPPSAPVSSASAAGAAAHASLEIAIATDSGREPSKQVNEDTAFARATRHGFLAVVCDGMGGHVGGREASQQAVATIFKVFDETPAGTPAGNLLAHAIREANTVVHARGKSEPELAGMGSTCVALLVHAGGVEIAHVGDSRVYMLSQRQVYQVTKDHSLVQRLVDANMITPEEAANHPNANQITNALGMRPDVDVELRAQPLQPQPGDTFVLCSDGLSDECGPQDLLAILAPLPTCDAAAKHLVDLANARGGHDNITLIVVRFPGGQAFTLGPAAPSFLHTPTATPAPSPTETLEMMAPPPSVVAAAIASQRPPPSARTVTPVEPPAARRTNVGLWVGVVLVLVATIAIALGVAMMRRSSANEPKPSSSASDDAPTIEK
ncbi:MAG: protein phosphatase 2C domain-containing protein, partial [Polyangiales bacterium]